MDPGDGERHLFSLFRRLTLLFNNVKDSKDCEMVGISADDSCTSSDKDITKNCLIIVHCYASQKVGEHDNDLFEQFRHQDKNQR
jgi:hypothetical protein